jgi:hypothetical protein
VPEPTALLEGVPMLRRGCAASTDARTTISRSVGAGQAKPVSPCVVVVVDGDADLFEWPPLVLPRVARLLLVEAGRDSDSWGVLVRAFDTGLLAPTALTRSAERRRCLGGCVCARTCICTGGVGSTEAATASIEVRRRNGLEALARDA